MADSGKSSRQVVERLIGDIDYFAGAVTEDADKMQGDAENLGNYWNDPQYKSFLAYMQELTSFLKTETKELDFCARTLEARLKDLT